MLLLEGGNNAGRIGACRASDQMDHGLSFARESMVVDFRAMLRT